MMGSWKQSVLIGGLLAPAFLLLVGFVFVPLLYTFYLSFLEWNMISPNKQWVGFTNYYAVLGSQAFWQSLGNTVLYTLLLLVMVFALPYILAYGLMFYIKRGQGLFRIIFFAPSVLSLAVASVIYLWLLNPVSGPIAALLGSIGIETPAWLSTSGWVIVALSVITAWKSFGYNFILFLSGMTGIPNEVIEAARLDRIPPWAIFWYIVRPLSGPTALYVLVLTIVMGTQYVFVPIEMLTKGGPDQGSTNLIFLTYQYAFQFFQTGKGAASAIIVLIIFAAFLFIQRRVIEHKVYYEHGQKL